MKRARLIANKKTMAGKAIVREEKIGGNKAVSFFRAQIENIHRLNKILLYTLRVNPYK